MGNLMNTLIFDVDGTLAETEELHRKAFNEVFAKSDLNWYWGPELYRKLLKISGGRERMLFYQTNFSEKDSLLSEENIALLHEKKTIIYTNWVKDGALTLRPGVKTMITNALERKITLAIATAASQVENLVSLTKSCLGLHPNEIFSFLSTGDLVAKKKPASDVYDLVLKEMSLNARECLAIEDSRVGLLAAKGAKIRTLISPSLYHMKDDFTEADYLCESLEKEQLPEELCQLLFL